VVKISWKPATGGVAIATGTSKLTLVSIMLAMAGKTVLRGRLQVSDSSSTSMACSTIQRSVFPRQWEGDIIVAEILTIRLNAIMASQAALSKCLKVGNHEFGLDLLVAGSTDSLVEGRIIVNMAVIASKRRAVRLALMGGENILEGLV
jgi:hypothetical protein